MARSFLSLTQQVAADGDFAFNGNKLTGLGAPVNDNDAANKGYVLSEIDKAIAGFDFQRDVEDIQTDATLDPGATPTAGTRYIITNAAALHANFGTIADLANNDIVEYSGTAWTVAYNVSVAGSGALTWNRAGAVWKRWDGTTWDTFGGVAGLSLAAGWMLLGGTNDIAMPVRSVDYELVAVTGTTGTLAYLPASNTVPHLYHEGQRLYEGVGHDFTRSGKTITLNFTPAGRVFADYMTTEA